MAEVAVAPAPAPTPPAEPPAPASPPAAAPAPPAAPATPPAAPPPSDWSEDWRTKISADDKYAKQLAQFASPKAIFESYNALRQKMSSGELRSALPEKATADELVAWRKDNGIPETPEGYELGTVAKEQAPFVEWAKKTAHELNLHPKQLQGFMAKRAEVLEAEKRKAEEESTVQRQTTEDAYRAEWGQDYRKNNNHITGLLDATAKAELKNDLLETMKVNPELGRWLIQMANVYNPVPTVVGITGNVAGAIEDELSTITKLMGDHGSDYWKGPKSEKMQARYRELVAAKNRGK